MGTLVYDFLNESLLFDEFLLEDNYRGVTESRLEDELASYRHYITTRLNDLQHEIGADNLSLRLFGNRDHFSIDRLKQTAFYSSPIQIVEYLYTNLKKLILTL